MKKVVIGIFAFAILLTIGIISQRFKKDKVYIPDYRQFKSVNKESEEILDVDLIEVVNEDVIGIVKIPNVLEEMVVIGEDNNEYLRQSIDKKYSDAGTCFADYKVNENSQNIVLYGHSSKTANIFFTPLMGYKEVPFLNSNKYIYFGNNKIDKYEIFSVYLYDVNGEEAPAFIKTEFAATPIFEAFVQNMKEKSMIDTNTNIENTNKIITLVTCNTTNGDERLVIMAKQI